ncbi:MAG TPA: polysaccharide biosynthesis/export family protein [Bryobacteraceae bacterium]|nr:polysaccharide biosynthesis/export family protein [Bryobacteraceae bacterium]
MALSIVFVLAGLGLLQAQATGQTVPGASTAASLPVRDPAYRVGPEDQININVVQGEEVNGREYKVGPDGDISVPLIGRVHAAGLTLDELEAELRSRFSRYIERPQLAVSITDFRSQPVSVLGAVVHPGTVYLRSRKTVLEAISEAGGLRPDAGPTATITRKAGAKLPLPGASVSGDGASRVQLNLVAATSGDSSQNLEVQAHDVIQVSEARMVYVLGEVSRQGGLPITGTSDLTIMQVISAAGGLTRIAASKEIRILRPVAGSTGREEIKVNFKEVLSGKSADVALVPNDIVFVPDNKGRRIATRVLESAISAGTSILTLGAVYR